MYKLPGRSVRAALRGARGRVRGKGRRRALISGALVVAVGLLAAPVHGERAQFGSLIVYLRGGISPRTLPRDHSTPVSVRLQAGIKTAESVPLPRVKKIRLELAYRGVLDTEGLAVCSRTRLRALDTRHAVAACGAAIVGTGSLYSRVFLPSQPPFGLHFQLLAFNGKTDQGPDRDLGPRLLAQSTGFLRPPLPCPSPVGALWHRSRQRRPAQRRAVASFRSLQHGRRPPLSLPRSHAQLPPRVLSAAAAVHIGPPLVGPRHFQHRKSSRLQRGNGSHLPCRLTGQGNSASAQIPKKLGFCPGSLSLTVGLCSSYW